MKPEDVKLAVSHFEEIMNWADEDYDYKVLVVARPKP